MSAPLAAYLRTAMKAPPHLTAVQAARLLARRLHQTREKWRDFSRASYLRDDAGGPLNRLANLSGADLPPCLEGDLRPFVRRSLAHRFDLLGSGWLTIAHGVDYPGIEGIRYPAGPAVTADQDGAWLGDRVTAANLPRARALWRMVDPSYTPIDWHVDFRSGWRWDPRTHFREVQFGTVPGADIKMPWELSRLQHLPQLALACLLAKVGRWDAAEAECCAAELRNQVLDFLATNPPRWGVNWVCPMDVGIRAANIALAVDLLRASGREPDPAFKAVVATALREHGRYIVANLEWHAGPRTNHYLGNLAGLTFCGAALSGAEADAWLAFAAHELAREIPVQFLEDGGCFEGSTLYHRLSSELVLFAVAALLGAAGRRTGAFCEPPFRALRVRPPLDQTPLAFPPHNLPLPGETLARLAQAAAFAEGILKPDGRVPQIGDTDSGRLFKLHPTPRSDDGGELCDEVLDIGGMIAAGRALFGAGPVERAEAAVVTALAAGCIPGLSLETTATDVVGTEHHLTDLIGRIAALPAGRRRRTELRLPGIGCEPLRALSYPRFGLYLLRGSESYLALRCAALDGSHDCGHTHDDNLHLEVWHSGRDLIADPGTYVYTSLPTQRRLYRSAAAHFVPRPADIEAVRFFAPFGAEHLAQARCLSFGRWGMAAELRGRHWTVWRAVEVLAEGAVIHDGCPDAALASEASAGDMVRICEGYGRITSRRVRVITPGQG